MQSTSRYVAVIATALAVLAIGCAEPTSPRQNSLCSGGGTETWDLSCSSTAPVIRVDTAVAKTP